MVARQMQAWRKPGDSVQAAMKKAEAHLAETAQQRAEAARRARMSPNERAKLETAEREVARIDLLKQQGHIPQDMPYREAYEAIRAAEAQVAAERQAQGAAEAEILGFARQLGPEHLEQIEAIYASQGWPGVTAALSPYLSPTALDVLTSTKAETGPDLAALGQRISQRIQSEEAAAAQATVEDEAFATIEKSAEEAIRRWTPQASDSPAVRKAKESSPLAVVLRDPGFHVSAAAWLAPRAAQLRAAGLLPEGVSPGEALMGIARTIVTEGGAAGLANGHPRHLGDRRWSAEEALSKLAEIVGEDQGVVAQMLALTGQAEDSHGLLMGVAQDFDRDRAVRARTAEGIGQDGQPQAANSPRPVSSDKRIATAMQRAAKATGYLEEERPIRADSVLSAAMAQADGRPFELVGAGKEAARRWVERANQPKGDSLDRAMARAQARLEGRSEASPTSGEDAEFHEALSGAEDHLHEGND